MSKFVNERKDLLKESLKLATLGKNLQSKKVETQEMNGFKNQSQNAKNNRASGQIEISDIPVVDNF